MTLTVDDQPYREPKAEPLGRLSLRNLVLEPIAEAETIEVDMAMFLAEADFADTIKMDLSDLVSDHPISTSLGHLAPDASGGLA